MSQNSQSPLFLRNWNNFRKVVQNVRFSLRSARFFENSFFCNFYHILSRNSQKSTIFKKLEQVSQSCAKRSFQLEISTFLWKELFLKFLALLKQKLAKVHHFYGIRRTFPKLCKMFVSAWDQHVVVKIAFRVISSTL